MRWSGRKCLAAMKNADEEVLIHPVGKDGQPWSGTSCYGIGCRCSRCRANWAPTSTGTRRIKELRPRPGREDSRSRSMNTPRNLRGPQIPAAGKAAAANANVSGHPAMEAAIDAVHAEEPEPVPGAVRMDPLTDFRISPGSPGSTTLGKVKAKRSYDYGPPPSLPVGREFRAGNGDGRDHEALVPEHPAGREKGRRPGRVGRR